MWIYCETLDLSWVKKGTASSNVNTTPALVRTCARTHTCVRALAGGSFFFLFSVFFFVESTGGCFNGGEVPEWQKLLSAVFVDLCAGRVPACERIG